MHLRRTLGVIVGTMLLLVLAGGGLLAWSFWQQRRALPATLLVVGQDARLRLVEANGTEWLLATNASSGRFRFPAMAPDGREIVFITDEPEAHALLRLDLITGERRELYRTNVNQPLNVAWSPDGRFINFLLASTGGLSVHLVPADGSAPAQLIATGDSSFYSWRHDGAALLIHNDGHMIQGGRLDAYDIARGRADPVAVDPGLFQAPAWSVDGQDVYYVAQPPFGASRPQLDDIQSQIVRSSRDGTDPQVLAIEQRATVRIVRAPGSNQLAYVAGRLDANGSVAWGALKLIDGEGGEPRVVSRSDEQVAAFFWSPDGSKLAYLSHQGSYDPNGQRTWHTVDVATGSVRDYGPFQPSQVFADFQTFFDAYLFSFSPWSPDGQRLAYGAEDGVYVLDLADGQSRRVTNGSLAMWVGGR